jgi:hypothetical protein
MIDTMFDEGRATNAYYDAPTLLVGFTLNLIAKMG